jgi:hypothetical protein
MQIADCGIEKEKGSIFWILNSEIRTPKSEIIWSSAE